MYWLEKSADALVSANLELKHGHIAFAVNRLYYACFYAFTAVLTRDRVSLGKHTAVRAALHRDYVLARSMPETYGRLFNRLFTDRHRGDYEPLTQFEQDTVKRQVKEVEQFIAWCRDYAQQPQDSPPDEI